MDAQLKLELFILLIIIILARILYLMHKITTGFSRTSTKKGTRKCKTVICIGSGGHTTEMLNLVTPLDFKKYTPRYYFVAKSDATSLAKIETLEKLKHSNSRDYHVITIPRSRDVHQSYFTSIFTTMYSSLYIFPIIFHMRPDLILCNGPGTCIPICMSGFTLKTAFITDTRTVFIESFCRTETFSLTGKILTYFADNFLVQWPSLKRKLKRSEYIGQLM